MKIYSKGFTVVEFLLVVLILGALGGVGWYVWQQNQTKEDTSSTASGKVASNETNEQIENSGDVDYPYVGTLRDVTMAKDVRGFNTGGNASGEAKAKFEEGTYSLVATISNTPDPLKDDFYEGWIVRKSPFKFISTGKLEKSGDKYINNYSADENLTEFDQYVLTIEPNDGDPAPADHIVEGVLQKN